MTHAVRDRQTLKRILRHCRRIEELRVRFGGRKVFDRDAAYQDAAAMNLLQIGELAKRLSQEFRATYCGAPWRAVCGMRDLLAHQYERLDLGALWHTMDIRIPELAVYCEHVLEKLD